MYPQTLGMFLLWKKFEGRYKKAEVKRYETFQSERASTRLSYSNNPISSYKSPYDVILHLKIKNWPISAHSICLYVQNS